MSNTREENIKLLLRRIPEQPGVYQYFDKDGQIIYVGKAKNLHRRVNSYFNKDHQSSKTRQLVTHIADIRYVVVESEQDAFLLENNLIKQYQPHYKFFSRTERAIRPSALRENPIRGYSRPEQSIRKAENTMVPSASAIRWTWYWS